MTTTAKRILELEAKVAAIRAKPRPGLSSGFHVLVAGMAIGAVGGLFWREIIGVLF
jgi:hypothetical protein